MQPDQFVSIVYIKLEHLFCNSSYELKRMPDALSGLVHLQSLSFAGCDGLLHLPPIGALAELTQLCLVGCGGLEAMPEGLNRLVGCCVMFDDGNVVVGSREGV